MVEVEVPAHSVVLSICLEMVSGKLGVICSSILFAIALAAAAASVAVAFLGQELAALRGGGAPAGDARARRGELWRPKR